MVDFPGVPGKMCTWDKVEAIDGAEDTLSHLSKSSDIYVATGAAESTAREIKEAFDRVGLSQYITGYFCKNNLGFSKGTPEFLDAILRKLNIPSSKVAMVGDSLLKDIKPAYNAGIQPIWLSPVSSSDVPPQTKIIQNLRELCL